MTTKPTRSATLKDVAELANVSISTASRVLSGGATVRSRLAERVMEAASELDYRPNLTARSLRRAQSMTFGAVFFKLDGPPAFNALRGLEWEARRHGYTVVTADADGDDERFIELLRRLVERQVDAVFVYRPPAGAGEFIEQTAVDGTPVIAISQRPRGMAIPLVTNRPTESIDLAV
ncbi:MAG: LacI family DNA-binding transcriptional regulator, partial [Dehalococcoidia bacterium]